MKHFNIMKTKEEIELLITDATSGDANAQNDLGCAYGAGDGIDKNYSKALECFQKSAEQSNRYACFNVGLYYELGRGTQKDIHKAIEWYKKALDLGFAKAALSLGKIFENGFKPTMLETLRGIRSLSADSEEAFYWYSKATSLAEGRFNIARCYELGIGTPVDIRNAVAIYRNSDLSEAKSRLTKILESYNPEEKTRLSTIELFRNNPFRVLGVFANASEKEIKANTAKISAYLKVGKSVDFSTDLLLPDTLFQRKKILLNSLHSCNAKLQELNRHPKSIRTKWGKKRIEYQTKALKIQLQDVIRCEENCPDWNEGVSRSDENIALAVSSLEQHDAKIRYAFFWFHCVTEEDKKAFESLEQGKWDDAKRIWNESNSYSSAINESVLDWYLRDDSFAIQGILSILNNPDDRAAFLSALNIPFESYSEKDLKRILWDALYSYFPSCERDFEWHELGKELEFEVMPDCGFDDTDNSYLFTKAFDELYEPLKELLAKASNWDGKDFESGRLLHDKLYQVGKRQIKRLKRLVGELDTRYIKVCDDVALELLEFAIAYNNNCKDWGAPGVALYTATWAQNLAVSEILRNRCQKNVVIFEENKRISTTDKILETIDEKFRIQENRFPTFQVVEIMIKDAEMYLECLESEIGKSSPLFREVSSSVVNRILNVLIKSYNTSSPVFSYSSISVFINKLAKFEMDEKTLNRVNKNKAIIHQNFRDSLGSSHQRRSTKGGSYQNVLNKIELTTKDLQKPEDSFTTKKVRKAKGLLSLALLTIAILLIIYLKNCGACFMANHPWWSLTIGLDIVVIIGCIAATWEAETVSEKGKFRKPFNWGSEFEIRDRRMHKVWATIASAVGICLIYWYLSWGNNYEYFWETQTWWICICVGALCLLNILIIAMWFLEVQRDPEYMYVFSFDPNEVDYSTGVGDFGCLLMIPFLPYYFVMLPFKLATLIR